MKDGRTASSVFFSSLLALSFFVSADFVSADAWWGYGYRAPKWILKHGGTIVYCEIENISGEASEYKMVLFDDDDDYVEKEFGTEVLFDDAKGGVYKIRAYRGGTVDRTTWKGGKKFAMLEFTAHPGETIKIKFNYKKKSAKMKTDYVEPSPKVAAKPPIEIDTEPLPNVQSQPDEPEPQSEPGIAPETHQNAEVSDVPAEYAEEIAPLQEAAASVAESVWEVVHPETSDDEAKWGSAGITSSEFENFFRKLWDAVAKFSFADFFRF